MECPSSSLTFSSAVSNITDFQRTTKPVVTGQSVLAIRYKDGIMMAADTQLCYGNHQKFKNVSRLFGIEQSKTLLGFSGEYSDVQHIMKLIEEEELRGFVWETATAPKTAAEIAGYLSRVMYNKRNKFNPLWNQIAIGGFNNSDEPYLGYVDFHGTMYEDDIVTTGFGAYFAIPLLREKVNRDMPESEARTLLEDCMKTLFARDCRAYNRIQIATVTREKTSVGEPYTVHPKWEYKAFTEPTTRMDLCSASW